MIPTSDNVTGTGHPWRSTSYPRSIDEVQQIVRQARRDGFALYPVSMGLNWGYGSRSPATPDNVLVDLGRMNRILNAEDISPDQPVAVIEPGVTQGQLHRFLADRCPSLTFNVTGAGTGTSLIGCAMDRGVGYFGPRKEDLFGLEVVLGTGEILRTGFRRLGDDSPLAHAHPYGVGPILDGLFFQGNFGIVTSACFQLRSRRPKEVGLSLSLRRAQDLGVLIDRLAQFKREGLISSVTHIGNRARNHSTLMFGITEYLRDHCGRSAEAALAEGGRVLDMVAPNEWSSLASVTGSPSQVRASLKEIKQRIGKLARILTVTETLLDLGETLLHPLRLFPIARAYAAAIHAMRPLHRLALGEPTDVPIQNLLWKFDHPSRNPSDLDSSRCGLLFINPALPLDGAFVQQTIEDMKETARNHGHTLYITLNIETPTSLVAVINMLFDRSDPEAVQGAHACARALLSYAQSKGLSPYRARIDMMSSIVSEEDPYWQTMRRMKTVLDPDNVIAPGRYNLP